LSFVIIIVTNSGLGGDLVRVTRITFLHPSSAGVWECWRLRNGEEDKQREGGILSGRGGHPRWV